MHRQQQQQKQQPKRREAARWQEVARGGQGFAKEPKGIGRACWLGLLGIGRQVAGLMAWRLRALGGEVSRAYGRGFFAHWEA